MRGWWAVMPWSAAAAAVSASHPRRDGHRSLGREEDLLGVARRGHGRPGHPVTLAPRRRARPTAATMPAPSMPGTSGRGFGVEARAVVDVDEVDTHRLHPDHDLTRAGRRARGTVDTQHLGPAKARRFESPSWNAPTPVTDSVRRVVLRSRGWGGVRKLGRQRGTLWALLALVTVSVETGAGRSSTRTPHRRCSAGRRRSAPPAVRPASISPASTRRRGRRMRPAAATSSRSGRPRAPTRRHPPSSWRHRSRPGPPGGASGSGFGRPAGRVRPPAPQPEVHRLGGEQGGGEGRGPRPDRREVLTGQAGQVVANRYRIARIGLESVDLGDVGSPASRAASRSRGTERVYASGTSIAPSRYLAQRPAMRLALPVLAPQLPAAGRDLAGEEPRLPEPLRPVGHEGACAEPVTGPRVCPGTARNRETKSQSAARGRRDHRHAVEGGHSRHVRPQGPYLVLGLEDRRVVTGGERGPRAAGARATASASRVEPSAGSGVATGSRGRAGRRRRSARKGPLCERRCRPRSGPSRSR